MENERTVTGMREILFRGKRLDNGEWVYGAYQPPVEWDGRKWDVSIASVTEYGWLEDILVIPETVGQFTGLTDRNGKRIFEGDIIKRFWLGAEIIYCVQYDGENAHFIGKALNKSGFTTFDNDGEMFEVIGNIHDNPELLKGGEG